MTETPFDEVETSHHYGDVMNLSKPREWGDEPSSHIIPTTRGDLVPAIGWHGVGIQEQ